MDERGWSWPAWKFGLKRDDLFTTLHDQYNTFASSIQDPEAFHHDVWEISNTAATEHEFRQLLADRKEQRLRELNETLESASFEIIANPKLIGTEQWQYAIQLFRTRSLDSLVRYFASYLPHEHPWHHLRDDDTQASTTASSISDSIADSVDSTSTHSSKPFFDDDDYECLTHEPFTIHTSIPEGHLPPSPRSMTMCTDSSAVSPIDTEHHDHTFGILTPARTLSFSENESDIMIRSGTMLQRDEDETSQGDDYDAPFSSTADMSGNPCLMHHHETTTPAECDGSTEDTTESGVPTPRPEHHLDSYLSHERPGKPSKATKSSHASQLPLYTQVLQEYVQSSRKGRRDDSPARSVRRTSPEIGRIQKPLPDFIRARPNGRRRND